VHNSVHSTPHTFQLYHNNTMHVHEIVSQHKHIVPMPAVVHLYDSPIAIVLLLHRVNIARNIVNGVNMHYGCGYSMLEIDGIVMRDLCLDINTN
jgi:hypothetical protein